MKLHTHVSTFLTGVNEPRRFSSEFEVPCPSTKLFHHEQFAIYGSYIHAKTVKSKTTSFLLLKQLSPVTAAYNVVILNYGA